ncbi:MAG: hypothetical protein WAT19_06115 [Ferruginibacter sp.]
MLKKLFLIALIISYGLSSFGVSLNYFYCCGKLKSVTLKTQTNPRCSPKKKKGCCENKKVSLKLGIDQKAAETKSIAADVPFKDITPARYAAVKSETFGDTAAGQNNFSNGPPLSLLKKNILHCVFRI